MVEDVKLTHIFHSQAQYLVVHLVLQSRSTMKVHLGEDLVHLDHHQIQHLVALMGMQLQVKEADCLEQTVEPATLHPHLVSKLHNSTVAAVEILYNLVDCFHP